MANETILVVDADEKIQKVLEVSLKKSGYRVVVTDTPAGASHILRTDDPDLIISETKFDNANDGFAFLQELKSGQFSAVPFIFLTEDRALPQKMKGFELGADDYLTKPFYLKEITTRADLLIQRRNKEHLSEVSSAEEFEGNLAEITMIDLLQTIENETQSGSIHIHRDDNDAVIYFQDGNILDAFCGKLQGEEAIYRLFLWPDGSFVVRYANLAGRPDRIEKDSSELLIEGIERLEEYQTLTRELPSLHSVYDADFAALARTGENFPAEVAKIFRLFDGKRTLRSVIDNSGTDDITTLKVIARLYEQSLIVEVEKSSEADASANLSSWLDGSSSATVSSLDEGTSPGFVQDEKADAGKPERTTERLLDAQKRKNTDRLVAQTTTDQHQSPASVYSSLDETSDAIREIEKAEARRREIEASHLSGQFDAVSREEVEARPRRKTEQLDSWVERTQNDLLDAVDDFDLDAPEEPKTASDTGELYVAASARKRKKTPIKSMASVAAIEEISEVEVSEAIEEDEASTAEIPNVAHAISSLNESTRAPTPESVPVIGDVSEADAFEDSEPIEEESIANEISDPELFDDNEVIELVTPSSVEEEIPVDEPFELEDEDEDEQDDIVVQPPEPPEHVEDPEDVPSTERPTKELRPLFPAVVDPDPSDPELIPEVGGVSSDMYEAPEFSVDDTPPEGSGELPLVTRTSTDGEIVTKTYTLSSPTVTPIDLEGPPTLETAREAEFFSAQPDTFDDLANDDPGPNNVVYLLLGFTAIVAMVGILWVMTQDPKKPVAKEVGKEEIAKKETPKELPKEVKKPTGLDVSAATAQADELAIFAENSATDMALVVSGNDVVIDTQTNNTVALIDSGEPKEVPPEELPKEETPKEVVPKEETPKEEIPKEEIPKEEKPKEVAPKETGDKNFKSQLAEAERLVKRKKWSDALDKLRVLSDSNPKSKRVAFLHGRAAFESNANSEAIQHFSRAERMGYKRADLFLDLAAAYQLDGKRDKAKKSYERFLEIKPTGRQADEVRAILANQF